MLIPSKKILFVHIPRTGGTTIEAYFRRNVIQKPAPELYGKKCRPENKIYHLDGRQHYPLSHFEDIDKIGEYYKFAFVRHPYHRLISAYEHSFSKKYHFKVIVCMLPLVSQFYRSFSTKYLCHLIPQHRFIASRVGCDFIGRYEQYERDCHYVLNTLKMPVKKMPHIFKTRKRPLDNYLDSFTKYLIDFSYSKDFDLFNYSRNIGKIST